MQHLYLCALCLCVMAAFIIGEYREKYVQAVLLKGLASAVFVVLGFLSRKIGHDSGLAAPILAGLILGMIADVLLNLRYVVGNKGKLVFLVGILVFLSGHIAYLLAIMKLSTALLWEILIGIVLTAGLMAWIFTRITAEKAFKIFGVFYLGTIMIMNAVAIGNVLTLGTPFTKLFALGAVLFLISDIVLILNTFGKESKFSLRIVNLSLYYIGQLLIALSLQLL